MAEGLDQTDGDIERRWNLDKAQKYLQIISVLAAAIWSLWIYINFDEQRHRLVNDKLDLEYRQGVALASIDRDAKALGVEQQRMALDQLKITGEQQKIALAQQTLAASIQREQQSNMLQEQRLRIEGQRLGLKVSDLDRRSRELQVGALSQTPLEQNHELSVERVSGRDNIYKVFLDISVTNKSQKEINIVAAELYGYLGQVPEPRTPNSVFAVNLPSYDGPVQWVQHFQYPYVSIQSSGLEDGKKDNFGRTVGGLAHGRLSTGETMRASRTFYVYSNDPSRLFGFSLKLHTEETGRDDWLYAYDGSIELAEVDIETKQPRRARPSI